MSSRRNFFENLKDKKVGIFNSPGPVGMLRRHRSSTVMECWPRTAADFMVSFVFQKNSRCFWTNVFPRAASFVVKLARFWYLAPCANIYLIMDYWLIWIIVVFRVLLVLWVLLVFWLLESPPSFPHFTNLMLKMIFLKSLILLIPPWPHEPHAVLQGLLKPVITSYRLREMSGGFGEAGCNQL